MSVVTRGFSASTSYLGYNIRVEKCLELGNLPYLNRIQIRLQNLIPMPVFILYVKILQC